VETDFGFHIIKMERARLAEIQARHILIVPEKTPDDVTRARDFAKELYDRASVRLRRASTLAPSSISCPPVSPGLRWCTCWRSARQAPTPSTT
jgi:hypothetical protein